MRWTSVVHTGLCPTIVSRSSIITADNRSGSSVVNCCLNTHMLVSHQHRVVFTHIPKTAGTSIRAWFHQHVPDTVAVGHKHQTPHHVTERFSGYDHFCVVRNPYDRLLSHYHFHVERYKAYLLERSRRKQKPIYHEVFAKLRQGFEHWLTDPYPMANRQADWYDYRWCPQAVWCTDHTHVLKFETLAEDFRWVQDRVGVREPLEPMGATAADTDHTTAENRVLLAPHRPLIQSHLMVDFVRFAYKPDFDRSGKL